MLSSRRVLMKNFKKCICYLQSFYHISIEGGNHSNHLIHPLINVFSENPRMTMHDATEDASVGLDSTIELIEIALSFLPMKEVVLFCIVGVQGMPSLSWVTAKSFCEGTWYSLFFHRGIVELHDEKI